MIELLLLTVVSALIGLLVPGAMESGIRKSLLFLCGVVVLYSVASLTGEAVDKLTAFPQYLSELFFPDQEDMEEYEEEGERWIVKYSVRNIEMGVSALVENRYGLTAGSVRTEAFTQTDDQENILVTHLTVYVDKRMAAYTLEIARYVTDMLACPCDVVISE